MNTTRKCIGYSYNKEACPIREFCERYTAPANHTNQSFLVEAPFEKKMGGTACVEYLDNRLEYIYRG